MKKLFISLALIATIAIKAQAPQGFNYQATVRNSSGALIVNQNVYFKFNVILNSVSSVPVFSETHYTPTDDLGQVNLIIGTGTATTGSFSTINWGTGNYYLGIEINTGSGYVAMGTTQLLSVPYALYANSSGNSNFNFPNGTNIGDTLNWKWNGSAWIPTSSVSTAQLPVIATTVSTNTLTISPSSGGTIISDGGYSITSKGVCWSTSPNPTINDNRTNNGTGASNFTSILSNLLSTTTYYYRAYATNSIGTGYGITFTFTTATIQTWTTTNLDVATYSDGTPIPEVTDPTAWENLTTGAWCYYNNDPANGTTYGKLYNWYAVAGIHDTDPNTPNKKLAPTGYHVPSDAEWTTLTTNLGGESVAGGKMKSTTGTVLWNSPNADATNSSGFTGLPGGLRDGDGVGGDGDGSGMFNSIVDYGFWWSYSEYDTTNAWSRNLYHDNGFVFRYYFNKVYGFSVRCLRD